MVLSRCVPTRGKASLAGVAALSIFAGMLVTPPGARAEVTADTGPADRVMAVRPADVVDGPEGPAEEVRFGPLADTLYGES
jgi:hypothetical protein